MRKVVKISILVYALVGLLIGIILSVYSLYDRSFTFHMGDREIRGVWSGVIALLFTPLIMGFVGFVHGILFWFPITYAYFRIKK